MWIWKDPTSTEERCLSGSHFSAAGSTKGDCKAVCPKMEIAWPTTDLFTSQIVAERTPVALLHFPLLVLSAQLGTGGGETVSPQKASRGSHTSQRLLRTPKQKKQIPVAPSLHVLFALLEIVQCSFLQSKCGRFFRFSFCVLTWGSTAGDPLC